MRAAVWFLHIMTYTMVSARVLLSSESPKEQNETQTSFSSTQSYGSSLSSTVIYTTSPVTSNYNQSSSTIQATSTVSSTPYTIQEVRYDKHKVYTLMPENDTQIKALLELEKDPKGLAFWTMVKVHGYPVEIMASDEQFPILDDFMKKYALKHGVLVKNVQELIDVERPPNKSASFNWDYFYDLDKIYTWMDSTVNKYPKLLSHIVSGYSYEGRPVRGVKLSYKNNNPGVFIESGTHAREWIAPATATWILNELLTSKDLLVRFVAENYDWYIFPSVNPDGYIYSYNVDRFWRKTRSRGNGECMGVDPNRNWNFQWTGGGDPCSIIYPGPKAFSENETRSLAEYVQTISNKIQVYFDFHSYGQILMFPYSYTKKHAENYEVLMRIGNKSAQALKERYGTNYTVGDIANTVYIANGSSLDWMFEVLKVPLCYAYELRDTGQTGLLLPPEQIIPTAQETMDSVVSILLDGIHLALKDFAAKNTNSTELQSKNS